LTVRTRYARPREELEERLIGEWAREKFPAARVIFRARLGRLPEGAYTVEKMGISPMLYTVIRHWADALIFTEDRNIIVEGKLKLKPEAVGQILVNRDLFKETPDYADRWDLPTDCIIVYAIGDPDTEKIALGHGIKLERYTPKWAVEAYTVRKAGLEAIR
jgi:hypothetical protein